MPSASDDQVAKEEAARLIIEQAARQIQDLGLPASVESDEAEVRLRLHRAREQRKRGRRAETCDTNECARAVMLTMQACPRIWSITTIHERTIAAGHDFSIRTVQAWCKKLCEAGMLEHYESGIRGYSLPGKGTPPGERSLFDTIQERA